MKRALSLALSLVLALSLFTAAIPGKAASAAEPPVYTAGLTGVQAHTPLEIQKYAASHQLAENGSLTVYKTQPSSSAPYALGALTDATLNDSLAAVNRVRYIAGLSSVTLDSEYNRLAQASALVNAANDELTHYPEKPADMSDELYQAGYQGSQSSNIAWGYPLTLRDTVFMYMSDSDSYNINRVGHRRWVIYPNTKKVGFGQVDDYFAMYAHDGFTGGVTGNVAWPAQSMPIQYFDGGDAWSLSTGLDLTASAINVVLTRLSDGKKWNFSSASSDGNFYVENNYYGQKGCIIFRPSGISYYTPGDYTVKITGAGDTIQYTVSFFDLYKVAAPTSVKATGETSGVKISWTGASPYGYIVYRSTDGTTFTQIATTTSTSYLDKSAPSDTELQYKVKAYFKDEGEYHYSAFSSAAVYSSAPAVPTGLKLASTGVGQATITWNKVANATGYCVYYKRADDTGYTYAGATTAATKTVTGLTTGARYAFKIRAYMKTSSGSNIFSDYCKYVSGEIVPATPTGLTITGFGVGKATIKWNKVPGAYAYCIYYKCTGDENYTYFGATTATSKTVTGLQPGRRAAFKIRAYCKPTDGPKAGQNVFGKYCTYVSDAIPLATPANFKVTSVGSGTATISWSKAANAKGYCLYYKCAGDDKYTYLGVTSAASKTFTGLEKGKQYAFKIRAYSGPYAGSYIYSAYTNYITANIPK